MKLSIDLSKKNLNMIKKIDDGRENGGINL
jgi:hypothetical protein